MPLTGHCLCKAVTYSIDLDKPGLVGYDHCDDCQRQSGSTYCMFISLDPACILYCMYILTRNTTALVTVVPKDRVTISGPTKSWPSKGSSGKPVHRIFCSQCGSPIAHDPEAAPEIIAIKAGTLDTEIKKTLKPVSS